MSVNINLVARKDPNDSKSEKAKKIKGISFGILIVTALFAVLIFALDYRFSASYVQKQQTQLLNELASFQDTTSKIFIVNSTLADTSTILSQRKKYNKITGQIVAVKPGDVAVDEYQIDENGTIMTISATSLSSVDQYLNSLLELVEKKNLSGVYMRKLTFESGKYVVELTIF